MMRAMALLLLASCAAGCRSAPPPPPQEPVLLVVTGTTADRCGVTVGGHAFTADEQEALLATLRRLAVNGRKALLITDGTNTPYRCFGSAVYAAQRAGFADIGFVSEPPPPVLQGE